MPSNVRLTPYTARVGAIPADPLKTFLVTELPNIQRGMDAAAAALGPFTIASWEQGVTDPSWPRGWPQRYGAVGDRTTDDTAALVTWYASIPTGGTGWLPDGYLFRFTSQLSWNRQVSVRGFGLGSGLIPDLNGSTDAIVVNNTAVTISLYNVAVGQFALYSTAVNCCRNGLVVNRTHLSRFDVAVLCKAAQYGYVFNGCLIDTIVLTASSNSTYPGPAAMPTNTASLVTSDLGGGSEIPCNANRVVCRIEGGGNGLVIGDSANQGDNTVHGTIEGVSGVPFSALKCVGMNLSDLHLEANGASTLLNQCANVTVGPRVQDLTAGHPFTLAACTLVTFDGVDIDGLTVDTASSLVTLGQFRYNQTGSGAITDPGNVILYRGPVYNTSSGAVIGLETWSAAMPAAGTWTAGTLVKALTATVLGSGGSQYTLDGWRRITTGSGNVLNTDWVERRALTGT